ncbi:hypothetical protein, partial [Streptococcus suis]|uniref:hypothetical protein n=1 Tax=Streptococcus suis TaxID=1307 RepID=UPI001EE6D422
LSCVRIVKRAASSPFLLTVGSHFSQVSLYLEFLCLEKLASSSLAKPCMPGILKVIDNPVPIINFGKFVVDKYRFFISENISSNSTPVMSISYI